MWCTSTLHGVPCSVAYNVCCHLAMALHSHNDMSQWHNVFAHHLHNDGVCIVSGWEASAARAMLSCLCFASPAIRGHGSSCAQSSAATWFCHDSYLPSSQVGSACHTELSTALTRDHCVVTCTGTCPCSSGITHQSVVTSVAVLQISICSIIKTPGCFRLMSIGYGSSTAALSGCC